MALPILSSCVSSILFFFWCRVQKKYQCAGQYIVNGEFVFPFNLMRIPCTNISDIVILNVLGFKTWKFLILKKFVVKKL